MTKDKLGEYMKSVLTMGIWIFAMGTLLSPSRAHAEVEKKVFIPDFEFEYSQSASNSYAKGELADWWKGFSGYSNAKIQTATGFYRLKGTFYFNGASSTEDSTLVGLSFGYLKPPEHTLWGQDLAHGGNLSYLGYGSEVVINPTIYSLGLPMKMPLGSQSLYFTLEPAIDIGTVEGSMSWFNPAGGFKRDITKTTGGGGELAAGIDAYLATHFGVNFRVGYRMLNISTQLLQQTKASPPTFEYRDVKIDLSGVFATLGASVRF